MARTHRIERSAVKGFYRYRGALIRRDDSQRGHFGYWSIFCWLGNGPVHGRRWSDTRRDLLAQIDQILDAHASAPDHN